MITCCALVKRNFKKGYHVHCWELVQYYYGDVLYSNLGPGCVLLLLLLLGIVWVAGWQSCSRCTQTRWGGLGRHWGAGPRRNSPPTRRRMCCRLQCTPISWPQCFEGATHDHDRSNMQLGTRRYPAYVMPWLTVCRRSLTSWEGGGLNNRWYLHYASRSFRILYSD